MLTKIFDEIPFFLKCRQIVFKKILEFFLISKYEREAQKTF